MNISIIIQDVAQLDAVLDRLEARGYGKPLAVGGAVRVASGSVLERNKAILEERGLMRAPRATFNELQLRTAYEQANGATNWTDLAKRVEIMTAQGYDIFSGGEVVDPALAKGATIDGLPDVDFDEVPE